MGQIPSADALQAAFEAAGAAHHEYEQHVLGGRHDEEWAGWYAAYVLGRLGDFTAPSSLTHWLAETERERPWAPAAARHVLKRLEGA